MYRIILLINILVASVHGYAQGDKGNNNMVIIPPGGNSWSSGSDEQGGKVSVEGIKGWTDIKKTFTTYIRFNQPVKIKLGLQANAPGGDCSISVKLNGISQMVNIKDNELQEYAVGEWIIKDSGYHAIEITGVKKEGRSFADITSLLIDGPGIDSSTVFVRNNEGNYFYWGRRGPSVHLNYPVPANEAVEWFYNEVTVPKGEDVIGSYFMANGFAEGYFGIQVNSPTERRVLFSVWSPFQTDDPNSIPDDQKIKLVSKGEAVHAGEFGDEGSGGQSFLRYNWKAGNTYNFLLHGIPEGNDHTRYSAYFFAPEKGEWMLIASFLRPKTNTYLKRLHSFLENFEPEMGDHERKVFFSNQWVCNSKGEWTELVKARFTGDNTARKKFRMDYGGGVNNDQFFLRNCGFFNDYTPLDITFERTALHHKPVIDFKALPK